MKKVFILISLLFVSPIYSLAPPPINFTEETYDYDGKKYEIKFDGKKVDIEEVPSIPIEHLLFHFGLGIYSWGLIVLGLFYSWPQFFKFFFIGTTVVFFWGYYVGYINNPKNRK